MVVLNVVLTLPNVVKIYTECDNVVFWNGERWFNIVNFNVDVHNVVSTLTYQPKNNVETTLRCLLGSWCVWIILTIFNQIGHRHCNLNIIYFINKFVINFCLACRKWCTIFNCNKCIIVCDYCCISYN